MNQQWLRITLGLLLATLLPACKQTISQPSGKPVARVIAEPLAPLEPLGYGGLFVGAANDHLLVAGGSNFPKESYEKNGKKVWYGDVLVCDGKAWKAVGKLPRPMAMGSAVTTPRGVLIIGGGDETQVYDDVFLLSYSGGDLKKENWPAFPKKIMAASAVLIGQRVYLVGGHSQTNALTDGPHADVWSLDLNDPRKQWRAEPPIPADPRWLPVVGTDGKSLFVFSGFTRVMDEQNKPRIHCLADAWKYAPATHQWTRLPDLPRANAAAPSPAAYVGGELLLLGGGVDDAILATPAGKRPPFPPTILAIDARTGHSRVLGEVKSSVVAAQSAPYRGGWAVPSGEIKAGVRAPAVWVYSFD